MTKQNQNYRGYSIEWCEREQAFYIWHNGWRYRETVSTVFAARDMIDYMIRESA